MVYSETTDSYFNGSVGTNHKLGLSDVLPDYENSLTSVTWFPAHSLSTGYPLRLLTATRQSSVVHSKRPLIGGKLAQIL